MRGWDVQARPFTGGPAGRFGDPSEGWRGPDGQTGLADASGYFDNLAPGTTALYRTDDADWIGDPSDWIMPS